MASRVQFKSIVERGSFFFRPVAQIRHPSNLVISYVFSYHIEVNVSGKRIFVVTETVHLLRPKKRPRRKMPLHLAREGISVVRNVDTQSHSDLADLKKWVNLKQPLFPFVRGVWHWCPCLFLHMAIMHKFTGMFKIEVT